MDEKEIQSLRESVWRRPLSDAERRNLEIWLADHPDQRADWELESALNRSLARPAEVEVSSNFTARVMAEIERPATAARLPVRHLPFELLRRWLPRLATVLILAAVGWWQFAHWQAVRDRRFAAIKVQTIVEVTAMASPELLADYEAIASLGSITPDTELLAMLE